MKKLLTFTLSVLWLLCFVWFSNATTSDCQSISYAWWNSICISINKNWNTYTLSRDITCPWGWCSLSCKILLPNNKSEEVWACDWDFVWDGASQWLVRIYARLNDTQKTVDRNYNFSAWSWWNVVYENTNLNNFYLSTNKTNPSTSQRVDLTIKARNSNNNILTNYTNRVKFDVYYRTSTSSSWNKTSSSYYYTINSSYTNWYKFISSDYGQKNLYDFIRFNKNNLDYKVRVYDENNSNIYNDIYFYVNTAETNSNIAWFTVKEVEMIQRIYNIRPQLIRQLKAEHPRFNTNTIWKNLWNDLYSNMKDVLDNKTWRKFTNYSKFFSDFMVWYNRTMDVIH